MPRAPEMTLDINPPLSRAAPLDPSVYSSAAVYEWEMREFLPRSWQVVAPATRLSGPGDVIARELGRVPIIIVRKPGGELAGFYNICPHRAGPLATCDTRGTKRLRCAYHGWAYNHDGQLTSAPEMKEAEHFNPNEVRLTPIDVREWNGLVWAKAGEGGAFEDAVSGIGVKLSEDLSTFRHHKQITYEVAANWKVYVDNYLEGYHLPFVHPGLTDVVDYGDYVTELGDYWSLQRSPVEAETAAYAAGEGLYFFIHPNTMLNIMPGRLQTNRVIPTGINTCKVEFDFYYAPGVETRAEEDFKFSDEVQEEDRLICEHVQKGLTSGIYKPGWLSPKREAGVWHWHNIMRGAYHKAGLL